MIRHILVRKGVGWRQHGFTLVELLVVIAIIGILVALLLPAVQAAREAARRSQCINNLKQIGLALHNYHDAHKTLPAGSGGVTYKPEYKVQAPWAAALLPYLELQNHYDMFDFDVNMRHPNNRNAVQVPVEVYLCPSDPLSAAYHLGGGILLGRTQEFSQNPATSMGMWYPGSMGPTHMDVCPFCPNPNPSADNSNWCCQGWNFGNSANGGIPIGTHAGMFSRYHKGVRFKQVTDGLSNTFMNGETIPTHCRWNCAFGDNFSTVSTNIPLNNMEDAGETTGNWFRTCGFKSHHPSGVIFAMGDASVQFVTVAIDFEIFNNLGTRAGGEVASLE